MYMKLMTIMALIAAVSAAPLYARDYVTKTNAGSVNWTRGTIVTAAASRLSMSDDGQIMDAHGIQSIPLNRARMESYAHARERSIENAVNILRGVRIDQRRHALLAGRREQNVGPLPATADQSHAQWFVR